MIKKRESISLSSIKSSLKELSAEERRLERERSKNLSKTRKKAEKDIEKLFLKIISKITWNVSMDDNRFFFNHDNENAYLAMKYPNSQLQARIKKKYKKLSVNKKTLQSDSNTLVTDYKNFVYFLNKDLGSPNIYTDNMIINTLYDGFSISIYEASSLDSQDNFNIMLNNFILKNKLKFNLESFNHQISELERMTNKMKKFMSDNSNGFLFGLTPR